MSITAGSQSESEQHWCSAPFSAPAVPWPNTSNSPWPSHLCLTHSPSQVWISTFIVTQHWWWGKCDWLLMCFVVFRADPLPSPKVQASNGSFRQPSLHNQPLLSTQQKSNACISPLTNGHTAKLKSPKTSGNLGSWKEEPDLSSTAALQFNQSKKRRRKKKRRHSEEQDGAEPLVPAAVEPQVDSGDDQRRKKRKKKRKRENNEENVMGRGCVSSHLDVLSQEEDWCHGGIWSLTLGSDTEQPGPKSHLAARTGPQSDSEKVKKRKKKKKKMEALLDTSALSASETWVYTLLPVCLHCCTLSPYLQRNRLKLLQL